MATDAKNGDGFSAILNQNTPDTTLDCKETDCI